MTTAERIAALFHDDGTVGKRGSRFLTDICDRFRVRYDADTDRWDRMGRWTFKDGSVITVGADGIWDLGYSNCFCWQGCGHNDDCDEDGGIA
jgi:hypothetical protein